MKSYNKLNSLLASVAAIVIVMLMTFTGCTTTADYTLGDEYAPSNQQMIMRTRSYKGGMVREASMEETPCRIFETRLFKTDSVKSTDVTHFNIGLQHNERFGVRKMGFVSQFTHMVLPDDSIGFGYRPIYDSMMFLFRVDTFAGDTTKPIKFNVYWLDEALVEADAPDTLIYSSYDPRKAGHLKADAQPIFTFTFPDQENGIYTNDIKLRLKETPQTKSFIDRLLCMDKLDENGLANNNVEAYKSDSLFLETFKGLWFEPAEDTPDGEGAIYSLDITDTSLELYGRVRNTGPDADIIADTLDISYVFYNKYSGDWGNVWAQSVKHDYSNSDLAELPMDESLEERAEVQIAYVDGCGGVVTELYFTDELLLSLRNINSDDDDYVSAAINQAMLRFYLEESDYDYANLDPLALADAMNSAIPRLGLYTNYKSLTPVLDYMYDQEDTYVLAYNGYLNRSRALYEMNISAFIQEIINALLALEEDANGNVDLSKLEAPRTMYIAPDASDQFTLSRSILQGSDHTLNRSSVELELTYTLVN